jgi:hypothetical protein
VRVFGDTVTCPLSAVAVIAPARFIETVTARVPKRVILIDAGTVSEQGTGVAVALGEGKGVAVGVGVAVGTTLGVGVETGSDGSPPTLAHDVPPRYTHHAPLIPIA